MTKFLKKDDVPSGTIPLQGTHIKEYSEEKFSFTLTRGQKVYYVAAQSQEEYDSWISVINEVKRNRKPETAS